MTATLYMDAVITPHRSLSRKGFAVLLGVVIAFNLAVGALMIALRAFPVPLFLGADILAVVIAFRASYRGAGQAERVRITADEVVVAHEWSRGRRTVWRSATAFSAASRVIWPDALGRLGLPSGAGWPATGFS